MNKLIEWNYAITFHHWDTNYSKYTLISHDLSTLAYIYIQIQTDIVNRYNLFGNETRQPYSFKSYTK